MKRIIAFSLLLMFMAGTLAGCAGQADGTASSAAEVAASTVTAGTSEAETAHYPVTIENNGNSITYEQAPERVVVLSYTTAEIMTALGLEDRIVALAPCMNTLDEVMEEYREAIAAMPVFDESGMTNGVPNLETVLSVEPDFVYGSGYSFYASSCGAAEDYLANSIGIYASEKTYTKGASLDELYTEIANIGKIFDVGAKAEALIEELKAREQAVTELLAGAEQVTVFVLDYDLGDGTYYTAGGTNFVDSLITAAGGANVFAELGSSYATVSPEQIIAAEPEYVLTVSYYTADDGQSKIDLMKTSADFADVPAVKENNFLSLGGLAVGASSGLQSLDALEALAEFLHPEAFT